MKVKFIILITAALFALSHFELHAQANRTATFKSSITVNGTSNIHDWNSKVEQVNGEAVLGPDNKIESLTVKIPVQTLKSGDKMMDKKTYETMLHEKHPSIIFSLTEPTIAHVTPSEVQVTLTGNLTIAGVTKSISFKSSGKKNSNGDYVLSGSLPVKITDFKMKIPTALLGTIKAGDAVTIKVDVTLPANNLAILN